MITGGCVYRFKFEYDASEEAARSPKSPYNLSMHMDMGYIRAVGLHYVMVEYNGVDLVTKQIKNELQKDYHFEDTYGVPITSYEGQVISTHMIWNARELPDDQFEELRTEFHSAALSIGISTEALEVIDNWPNKSKDH